MDASEGQYVFSFQLRVIRSNNLLTRTVIILGSQNYVNAMCTLCVLPTAMHGTFMHSKSILLKRD